MINLEVKNKKVLIFEEGGGLSVSVAPDKLLRLRSLQLLSAILLGVRAPLRNDNRDVALPVGDPTCPIILFRDFCSSLPFFKLPTWTPAVCVTSTLPRLLVRGEDAGEALSLLVRADRI